MRSGRVAIAGLRLSAGQGRERSQRWRSASTWAAWPVYASASWA